MRLKPQAPPETTYCPVCDGKRSDVAAIAEHNERCASFGERSYPR